MNRRLFIALNLTNPLAKSFLPTFKKLKINADRREYSFKWVPVDNFHATLTFIGETPEEQIPEIQKALQEVCDQIAPFDLKIEDMSAFSNEHDARVIWLGVQNKKAIGELKYLLDQTLLERSLLLRPDERGFSPHMTIGRLKNSQSVKDLISPFKRKSFGKVHVSEVVLYESKMQGNFPVYMPLWRCSLQGEDAPMDTLQDETNSAP